MSNIFSYTEKDCEYLSKRDSKLGELIAKRGFVRRELFDDVFEGLCFNIINQQLSQKAAKSLFERLRGTVGAVVPNNVRNTETLLSCGLSRSKSECIALCAEQFLSGKLSERKLSAMSDSDAVRALTALRGIGDWTAEMTLIFCLGRRDVLSLSDFGIRRGISILHKINTKDRAALEKFKALYSPLGTVASIYLWEVTENELA